MDVTRMFEFSDLAEFTLINLSQGRTLTIIALITILGSKDHFSCEEFFTNKSFVEKILLLTESLIFHPGTDGWMKHF